MLNTPGLDIPTNDTCVNSDVDSGVIMISPGKKDANAENPNGQES